jgi:hypothetical protein
VASRLSRTKSGRRRLWIAWIANARDHGIVAGYWANDADYPPLAHTILGAARHLISNQAASDFHVVKLTIVAFFASVVRHSR